MLVEYATEMLVNNKNKELSMSFSYSVKKELCSLINDKEQKYACFYGMLLFCKQFKPDNILFQTENDIVADFFCRLADDLLHSKNVVKVTKTTKKNNIVLYSLSIDKEIHRFKIIYMFKIKDSSAIHRIEWGIITEKNICYFTAGAFLSCGSITEPMKEYHLEMVIPYNELMEDIRVVLQSSGINFKTAERKNSYIMYLKESESIEDFLTLLGATESSIDLMNIKILKDVRNKANRIANCDAANIERTVRASEKQIEDIEYIEKAVGLDYLPVELQNIAEIRLEYPECSLRELGEMLDKPLGRSGANHRLRRISEIAEELRAERSKINE